MAEKLDAKLAFEARYTAMPMVVKLELKFEIVSLAYSEKLSVSEFTDIIKQMHGKFKMPYCNIRCYIVRSVCCKYK